MPRARHARVHNPKRFVCPKCSCWKSEKAKTCRKCIPNHAPDGTRGPVVLKGIAEGKTMLEIALEIGISVKTVEYHWAVLKSKHKFKSYQDVTRYAIRNGLIEA